MIGFRVYRGPGFFWSGSPGSCFGACRVLEVVVVVGSYAVYYTVLKFPENETPNIGNRMGGVNQKKVVFSHDSRILSMRTSCKASSISCPKPKTNTVGI